MNEIFLKITRYFILMSLFLISYILYKSEFINSGLNRENYLIIFLFLIIIFILSCINFFKKKEEQFKINLLLLSIIFGIYFVEFFLYFFPKNENIFEKLKLEKKTNPSIDSRDRFEFFNFSNSKNEEVVLRFTPDNWINSSAGIFPLGGVGNKNTMLCNESGKWITFQSDRYGFNNPDLLWDQEIFYLLVGDSFTQGDCVDTEKNIASNLSKLSKKKVLNLGYGGNGPLIELAALVEYSELIKPKHIIWFYYEGNDLLDFNIEIKNEILLKYLNDKSFKQNLIDKQDKINLLIKNETDKIKQNYSSYSVKRNIISFIKLKRVRALFNKKKKIMTKDFKSVFMKAKSIAETLDSNFTVIIIPSYERYREKQKFISNKKKVEVLDRHILNFENFLKTEKINFINLNDDLFSNIKDPLSFFPFRYNNHFSEKGYYLISNFLNNNL